MIPDGDKSDKTSIKGTRKATNLDEVASADINKDLISIIKRSGDVERRRERDQHLLPYSPNKHTTNKDSIFHIERTNDTVKK